MLEDYFNDAFASYNLVEPPEGYNKVVKPTMSNTIDINPLSEYFNSRITNSSELNTIPAEAATTKPWMPTIPISQKPIQEQKITLQLKNTSLKSVKGTKSFEEAFAEAVKINPSILKYKNFLTKTSKIESNFDSYVQNKAGSKFFGYFLMGENEIKSTTGLSVEQFRNDPVALILGAAKLYEMNLATIKRIGVYDLGKSKGYSDDALVAGAWMGGPGGVKKYLKGLGDSSDSHWYKNGGGSSVSKRMNEFNK